jgi:ribonuclease Z
MGTPATLMNNTIDVAHTVHYAAGYLMKEVNLRLAMVTHLAYDDDMIPEILAGIRQHYNGFFQFGAPDVVVVNVQKDAIWTRRAALAEAANAAKPSPAEAKELFDISPKHLEVVWPEPKNGLLDIEDADARDEEIDKDDYYPAEVDRDLVMQLPQPFKIEIPKMVAEKLSEKIKHKLGRS